MDKLVIISCLKSFIWNMSILGIPANIKKRLFLNEKSGNIFLKMKGIIYRIIGENIWYIG